MIFSINLFLLVLNAAFIAINSATVMDSSAPKWIRSFAVFAMVFNVAGFVASLHGMLA